MSNKGNIYIYVMYVYDYNSIMKAPMKNRSDKEIICAFTELTKDLKTRGLNPIFHVMDNEASTEIKKIINTIYIKYQLFTPGNHRSNNAERFIQTLKKHFIAGFYSVDTDFHLQLWDRMLQQPTISLNLL